MEAEPEAGEKVGVVHKVFVGAVTGSKRWLKRQMITGQGSVVVKEI